LIHFYKRVERLIKLLYVIETKSWISSSIRA